MDVRVVVLAVVALAAAWMLRWDVEPLTSNNFARLDRWTGAMTVCAATTCYEAKIGK